MQEIKNLSAKSINHILDTLDSLEEEKEISCALPGNGFLHIEKELPYLAIYRRKRDDRGTRRFILSEASYLVIGTEQFENYQKLIYALSDRNSTKFKSYLLFEIYSGEVSSFKFRIKGPDKRLPSTLKTLKENLLAVNEEFSGIYLDAEISDSSERQAPADSALMSIEEAKKLRSGYGRAGNSAGVPRWTQ